MVSKAAPQHEGEYTVHADNCAGSAQTSANLCVQGNLHSIESFFDNNFYLYSGELVEFLEKLQDAEVKEGNSFQLSILVSAAAKSVAWQKDGQAIVTGEEGGFEVRNNAYNC